MYKNNEGYADSTAGIALSNVIRQEKMKYKRLVYICSPYAGDVNRNVENAKRYSRFAVKEGYVPIAPHLLFPQFLDDNTAERDIGLKCGYALLKRCQEVWVFGDVITKGMSAEIRKAEIRRNISIRYFDTNGKEMKDV